MKTSVLTLLAVSSSVIIMFNEPSNANPPDTEIQLHKIIDFASPEARQSWTIINDDVMGGRSTSVMRIVDEGVAEFSGVLSLENNGGFALTRSALLSVSLEGYDGIRLRVRGDGRSYRFRLRTTTAPDGASYQREFPTSAGEWTEIVLPFSEFVASYRGRLLPNLGPVNASEIQQLGFLIADKQPGPFTLTIAWIAAYRGTGQSPENTGRAGG